jgi:hypothetical protein
MDKFKDLLANQYLWPMISYSKLMINNTKTP